LKSKWRKWSPPNRVFRRAPKSVVGLRNARFYQLTFLRCSSASFDGCPEPRLSARKGARDRARKDPGFDLGKLTARQVETLKAPGRHADDGDLYLKISKAGAKSWVFFYRFRAKQREMGLGSLATTNLAEARVKALEALKQLKGGTDPLLARRAEERAKAGRVTFGQFADEYLKAHEGKFRNAKHAA
jgi:hypothetical protein